MITMPLPTSWFWTWEKKTIHPSSLENHSLTLPKWSSTPDLDKSTSNSLEKRYAVILIVIPLMSSRRSLALGGDVDHPKTKRINPQRKVGIKMRNLKKLYPLHQSHVHRPSRYGKRRWHHLNHCHKMCSHPGLHCWDRMMHPKSEGLFSSKVLSRGLKIPNPRREVTSVVIHIYFLALHDFFSL